MTRTLEQLLNRPVVGWINAALYDVRIGIPLASTLLSYRVSSNDPKECIAAGVFVGLTMVVSNIFLYARLDEALETQSWDEVIGQHPARHARIWAEANGQIQKYQDTLED